MTPTGLIGRGTVAVAHRVIKRIRVLALDWRQHLYFHNITSMCYYLAHLQSVTEFYLYQGNTSSKLKKQSYSTEVIASSPSMEIEHTVQAPIVTQLQCSPRPLPARVAAMSQILVHTCTKSILVLG